MDKYNIPDQRRHSKDPKIQPRKSVRFVEKPEESEENEWDLIASEYKVKKIIGKGTFGQVAKVKHVKTKKKYAIKLLSD